MYEGSTSTEWIPMKILSFKEKDSLLNWRVSKLLRNFHKRFYFDQDMRTHFNICTQCKYWNSLAQTWHLVEYRGLSWSYFQTIQKGRGLLYRTFCQKASTHFINTDSELQNEIWHVKSNKHELESSYDKLRWSLFEIKTAQPCLQ